MNATLIKRLVIVLLLIGIFTVITIITVPGIRLNMSIHNLFPYNEELQKTLTLTESSTVSRKVLLYIEADREDTLSAAVPVIMSLVENSDLTLDNTIPDSRQVSEFMQYIENNALLLYPYEERDNPFTPDAMKKGLAAKEEYLYSLPFMNPGPSFFADPLMLQGTVFSRANSAAGGRFNPSMGGLASPVRPAWLGILHSGFPADDFEAGSKLAALDREIVEKAKELKVEAFLYGAALYYQESQEKTMREVFIIFLVSILLTLLVFYYFYRSPLLLLFGFMPVFGGFALTFLAISLFFEEYGGIAFAFGATTSGIAIDYTIHYLTKRSIYQDLKQLRRQTGFSMILGAVTTVASFIFLPFSGIVSLQQISLFGLLTITFAFLISWFVLQRLLPPGLPVKKARMLHFPLTGRRAIIAWAVVLTLLLVPLAFLRFEDNVMNLDRRHREFSRRIELIQEGFNQAADSVFIAFSGATRHEATAAGREALAAVYRVNPDLAFFSPSILAPDRQIIDSRRRTIQERFDKKLFYEAVADSIFSVESFTPMLKQIDTVTSLDPSSLPDYMQREIDAMFVQYGELEYLLVPITERDRARETSRLLEEQGVSHFLVDSLEQSAEGLVAFEKSALLLLAASMIVILCLLWIAYRSIISALMALLPAATAMAVSLAVAMLTMRAVNIMHITAAILLLGIGVDYGIFMTSMHRRSSSEQEKSSTIQSIFISGLTTLAGFGILVFCGNLSVFSLGSSMLSGILAAFFSAWLVIPPLSLLLQSRRQSEQL
jgi:predicted exporter